MEIIDKKAKYLEEKGFYRRAADRWAEIMVHLSSDAERKLAAQKRAFCINKSLRNNLQADNYSDIKQGVYKAYKKMGLVNEKIFRSYKEN
ncbi:PerC family transcriptional regulator [Escherichia albertii]|nr:PerC family transcriptional regulator [Escherichia albertii]EEW3331133.1 PerC family transcriptional regulator [Escherichia albertii]EEW7343403.1 PerC family transcriptional regulator [Escherichia albertii]